jgi:glucuronate isomerase
MPFIDDNFLLQTGAAQTLYDGFAKNETIIDYHCHLPPDDIAADKRYENITQLWLYGDHYKWRAMRTDGVDERFCTGKASDWEKFEAWAHTVPKTLRNPLYHWTHLELARYFGITDRLLNGETAKSIWNDCNAQLPELSTQTILKKMNVRVVCTTDDPTDSLEHHISLAKQTEFGVKVFPTFRPDKMLLIENAENWNSYLDKLSAASNIEIRTHNDALAALRNRHDFFARHGCRLSDSGIETMFAEDFTESEIKTIFEKARSGKSVTKTEVLKYKSAVMFELGIMNAEKKWTQQFHIGALRNNNSRMLRTIGADSGYDSIGDLDAAAPLAKYLNALDDQNKLTKTILYNLNPRDNEVYATMIGNFQDGTSAGKLQYGSGWWFLDQKDGMEKQLNALSNMGLLSRFVGMVTDSRSFLSYPRHEYFRRTLCNLLGAEIENGLLPNDVELVGSMVRDICYRNAEQFFGFFND